MSKDRMKEIYDDCLGRFNHIKDYNNKSCIEDIINNFKEFVGDDNPYFYDMLYMDDRKYEDWSAINTMQTRSDYDKYIFKYRDFYGTILSIFKDCEIKEITKTDPFVSESNTIIEDFLKTIDMEAYKMFDKMDNNVFRVLGNGEGKCLYDPEKDENYAMIGKNNNFVNMVSLVHELGHCFRDYMFKTRNIDGNFDENLRSEIFSETLELAFIKYLIDNDIYSIDASNYLTDYNNKIIKVSNSLLQENFIHDNGLSSLTDLKYLIGRILAYYFLNSNMTLKEFFLYINNHTLLEILSNPDINYQEISDNLNKNYCLKKQ